MPELSETMYCSEQICIPPTFPYLLRQYAKAAIRTQPTDLLRWSTAYFRCLALNLPPPVKPRLEYPIPRDHHGMTPGWLKALLYQLGQTQTVPFKVLWDRWMGACLQHDTLIQILCLGCNGFMDPPSIDWFRFIALCAGHLSDNLTQTMILFCEIVTEEPEGGSAMIPLETFVDCYVFLANLDASKPQVIKNIYFTDSALGLYADAPKEEFEAPPPESESIGGETTSEYEEGDFEGPYVSEAPTEDLTQVISCPDIAADDFKTDEDELHLLEEEQLPEEMPNEEEEVKDEEGEEDEEDEEDEDNPPPTPATESVTASEAAQGETASREGESPKDQKSASSKEIDGDSEAITGDDAAEEQPRSPEKEHEEVEVVGDDDEQSQQQQQEAGKSADGEEEAAPEDAEGHNDEVEIAKEKPSAHSEGVGVGVGEGEDEGEGKEAPIEEKLSSPVKDARPPKESHRDTVEFAEQEELVTSYDSRGASIAQDRPPTANDYPADLDNVRAHHLEMDGEDEGDEGGEDSDLKDFKKELMRRSVEKTSSDIDRLAKYDELLRLSMDERRKTEEQVAQIFVEEEKEKEDGQDVYVDAVPGIGPIVPRNLVETVIKYMEVVAGEQHGMVMPRNIRHYNCPPLEVVS